MEDGQGQAEGVGDNNTFLEGLQEEMVFWAYDGVAGEGEYKPFVMEGSIGGCRKEGK